LCEAISGLEFIKQNKYRTCIGLNNIIICLNM